MMYHVVNPETAGGWGERTRSTTVPGQPTIVHELDCEFDDWLGDELLAVPVCYIVTEGLAGEINRAGLSGVVFDHVVISKSGEFEDWHPDGLDLPKFLWMKVVGEAGRDDFGLVGDFELVVSDKALAVLQSRPLQHAIIDVFEPGER